MTIHPSVCRSHIVISSADANPSVTTANDFRVNILGHLPETEAHYDEYYVRLIASQVSVSTSAADPQPTLSQLLSIHADFGQRSVLGTNSRISSNFIGVHTNVGAPTTNANPFIRCSRPQLGTVNIQVRDLRTGALAVPTAGGVIGVVLVFEFIPVEHITSGRF